MSGCAASQKVLIRCRDSWAAITFYSRKQHHFRCPHNRLNLRLKRRNNYKIYSDSVCRTTRTHHPIQKHRRQARAALFCTPKRRRHLFRTAPITSVDWREKGRWRQSKEIVSGTCHSTRLNSSRSSNRLSSGLGK